MKLFVLDGSWFLYRAYYAFPPMTNSEWRNVNVVYGFFRMILKIIAEKPDYFIVARDSPVKTHRHDAFPEYKANRKKMEDDFKSQIPLTRTIVDQLGIPNVVAPWYEADDIIATLATMYKNHKDFMTYIYSSDKDLKQLLDTQTVCIDPMKSLTTDVKSFYQEFAFEPQYIVDYLSLIGDSSDNIKWVTGIGPKKASELITKYHDIDSIYAHIDELSWDIKDKLITGKEDAYKSKSLIQLHMVDEVTKLPLEKFKFSLDYDLWKRVLSNEYHFTSFDKVLDEIKKKSQLPVQSSLF